MASRRPEYLGEPTLAQVMRRPQWIFALVLAFAVAAVFAWLGRWQAEHAIRGDIDELSRTETVRPLESLTDPIAGVPETAAGAVVSISGDFVPGDFVVVENRMNQGSGAEKVQGSWVVGRLATDGGASLAVAVGWAPSAAAARTAIARLDAEYGAAGDGRHAIASAFEGRYMPPEAPEVPKPSADPHVMRTMVPAYLANAWIAAPTGPIYGGYLVLHASGPRAADLLAVAQLDTIDSVAPTPPERVNWLNAFYAIEWVVFAGVALFLWYRLARDAWEKEHELMLLAEQSEDDRE